MSTEVHVVTAALEECEQVIEAGLQTFVDVGAALLRVRDQRLYRYDFGTFEDYCEKRWQMSRRRAYQMIEASAVVLSVNNCSQPNGDPIPLPENEGQARALVGLDPETAATVLTLTADENRGRLTADSLRQKREEITQPAKVTTTSRTTEATKVERNVDMATGEILDGQIPATEDRRPPAAPPVIPITEEQAEALDSLMADPSVRNSNLRKRFAAWIASINQAHLFDPAEMARIYPDAEEALTRNVTGMADFLATYKASTQSNRRIRLVKEA